MKAYKQLLHTWFRSPVDSITTTEDEIALKSAIPFVFDKEMMNQPQISADDYDPLKPLDLPFPVCSFEVGIDSINLITKSLTGLGNANTLLSNGKGVLPCIVIHEIEPNKYNYWFSNIKQNENKEELLISASNILYNPNDSQDTTFRIWIYGCLKLLEQTCVTERVNEIVKTRKNGKNSFTRIQQVVRVYPKSTKKHSISPAYGGRIDYSHRWTVRGHWRTIGEHTGKNREGLLLKGYTWVKNHIKGPENKILIKKTRFLANHKNTN